MFFAESSAKKAKSRYELKEKLGEGGMGVVWRAHDLALNIDVALKLLLDVHDPNALRLFYEECEKQASLAHPNIVEIRDKGSFDEEGVRTPYMVMPLLRGKTLAMLIRSSPHPLASDRCLDVITQASRGLQAAHDAGLLHRDIKPSNVFVLEDDSVKLLDFGVAHRMDLSRTTGRKGTLLYMSPEQLAMQPLTRSSDVFSLGVVCYETLTRKQPFLATSEEGVAEAIRSRHPPPASSINSAVSVGLSQVLCKAMAKNPAHRFASVKEFSESLRRAHYDPPFTVFDPAKFQPRLAKAAAAYAEGNLQFAQELVDELQSEGYFNDELTLLCENIKGAIKKHTIEQLLESARARVRDGEFRLALQRVSEVLDIEPRQVEALVLRHDIEARRAEADVIDWLDIGQRHLEKLSFSHARQAAQRILEDQPGEERAMQLLSHVERRQQEVQRLREQKSAAYAAAVEAESRNEITTALSKMRLVLELEKQAPDANKASQLAAYQSLYNKLHSEHEAIAASYSEAKQALDRGEYAAASRLCDRFLLRLPQHTLFKALRFDIEQRWRRAISTRLIEVEQAVEGEADLSKSVLLLEDVVRQSPEVPEFSRLLAATRQKRDLVEGIVTRARELEKRELHAEALVQWETLQTIYPSFPGLTFEIENVRLRRQLSERMEQKSHWLGEITESMEKCEFDQGLQLASHALESFPADAEFLELRAYLVQQQELAETAERLIRDGQRALEQGDFPLALEKLRTAYDTGSKVKRAKSELVEGLLRSARASQKDSQQARAYLTEILNLEPGNHAATGLLRFLDEQTEYQQVDETLAQARQLRTSNDLQAALELLRSVMQQYPRNVRLRQLLNEMDASRLELRGRDLDLMRRKRLEAATMVDQAALYATVASVEHLAERYGDDEEFQAESQMLRARLQTIAGTADAAPQRAPQKRTAAPAPLGPRTPPTVAGKPDRRRPRRGLLLVSMVACMAVLVSLGAWLSGRKRAELPASPALAGSASSHLSTKDATITLRSNPEGALILRDGHELGRAAPTLAVTLPAGKSTLEARLPGFESKTQNIDVVAGSREERTIVLAEGSQRLQILGNGRLRVDTDAPTNSAGGRIDTVLSTGRHTLLWKGSGGEEQFVHVDVENAEPAVLTGLRLAPGQARVLAVSVQGEDATVYAGEGEPLAVDGERRGLARRNSTSVTLANGSHTIFAGRRGEGVMAHLENDSGRLLLIAFGKSGDLASLAVTTDVPGTALKLLSNHEVVREGTATVDQLEISGLPAGTYQLLARAPGLQRSAEQTVLLRAGEQVKVSLQLKSNTAGLRVHALAGSIIALDGNSAGTIGSDGTLFLSAVASGMHRLDAHLNGKSVSEELTISPGDVGGVREITVKAPDPGTGVALLLVSPAESQINVFRANSSSVAVTGRRFELPAGRYRFVAKADGYSDRTNVADISPGQTTSVDLRLSPMVDGGGSTTLKGWGTSWTVDEKSHTLSHTGTGIGFYSEKPGRGHYIFSGPLARGFLLNRPKVEWVAGYHDSSNYLLFSLDHNGLTFSSIVAGKKQPATKIDVVIQGSYHVMMSLEPGRVSVSLLEDGTWKLLHEWTGLPQDLDQGGFGFKDAVTLTSFKYNR